MKYNKVGWIGVSLLLAACNDGPAGADGAPALVVRSDEAAGANCENGGQKLTFGADRNGDGKLSGAETSTTTYVCDSAVARGAIVTSETLDVGDERCPTGGLLILTGIDADGDGKLSSEEALSRVVCNGAAAVAGANGDTGIQGAQGDIGAKGDTGVPGDIGAKGDTGIQGDTGAKGDTGAQGDTGAKGDTGIQGDTGAKGDTGAQGDTGVKGDTGAQGETGTQGDTGAQGETGTQGDTGAQGDAALLSLILATAEPAGENCKAGGILVQAGIDDDGDKTLEPAEVDSFSYVCSPVVSSLRKNIMICGSFGTEPPYARFFPVEDNLTIVHGCAPDDDTQALLVIYDASSGIDGAALKTYVQGGGIVLSSYNNSDELFSMLFTAVTTGSSQGGCYDVAPTVFQYNATDQFWKDNLFTSIAGNKTGCGFDVAAYPGITPLAGWSASTVGIAYRDLGEGRFYMADFDWFDTSNTPLADRAYSESLLGYMGTHRR